MTSRRLVVTASGVRDLTVLELLRACSVAGVRRSEWPILSEALRDSEALPELAYRAALLAYAIGYVRAVRTEPLLTWADAQALELVMGDDDAIAEADAQDGAQLVAAAAAILGVGPAEAGASTLRQLEAAAELRGRKA